MSDPTSASAVTAGALARLFGRLQRQEASGLLNVQHGEGASQAFFREGILAGAKVHGRFKPLGIFLLEAGIIDIEALNASLTIMAKAKVPQGQVLVELGAITRQQLDQGLRDQQLANIEAFLHLEQGSWSFEMDEVLPPWTTEISLDPEVAVLAACRDPGGHGLVRSTLEAFGGTRAKLQTEAAIVVERFGLGAADARALRSFDGVAELDELAVSAELELGDVLSLVAALSCFDLVLAIAGDGEITELLPDPVSEETPAAEPVAAPAPPPEEALPPAAEPASAGEPGGESPEASEEKAAEEKAAEKRAARSSRPRGGTDEERKRRARLLKKAFQNIPGAERLAAAGAVQQSIRAGAAQKIKEEASEVRREKETEERRAKLANRRTTEEERTFMAEVKKWHQSVKGEDFYQRLRVKRAATAGEVKAGYLTLAKRFHPDRASAMGLDADTAGRLAVVFEAIKEAYDTLKSPEDRKSYDAQLRAGVKGAGQDRSRLIAAAQMQFRKGMVFFKKKDFETALPLLLQAHKADPKNGNWTVHYTWALYTVGPASEVREKVERLLKMSATAEEGSDKAYYYLGLLARMDGELDKAERYLSKALRINERLTEATTELRLIKRRMERESGTSASRLMRRILGD